MNALKSFFNFLFGKRDYSTDLEKFVVSKKPQTIKEVEHWSRVFDEIHEK